MKRISKNTGRAISMVLAAAMTIAPVNAFAVSSDVRGHWAEKTITEWQDKGLIGGYQDGTFKPNKPTTRAEFARIMNQALALDRKRNVAFSDVSYGDWFYNDVAIALGESYTAGYPDGTFKPNETITRAQAAVFIANAIDASGDSVPVFTDSASIPAWAKGSVGAIVEKGYMSGYPDGSFKPNEVLTRAEAVSTLNRIMGTATDKKETPAPDPVPVKNVVIDVDDTKLENQTITGNVIISEKVGDGEVYLNNVVIQGDLIVQGGGDDSIYLYNTTVEGKTILDKKAVRLQVSGKTKLSKVEIKKDCNLTTSGFTGEVCTIIMTGDISDKTTIGVPADKLVVEGKANLLTKKEIGEVIIEKNAGGTKLEVENGSKVSTLTADGKVVLSGSGTISKLEANVSNITYTSGLTISKMVTARNVEEPTKTTTTSSDSSNTNDDSSSKKTSISVNTAAKLEAAIANNNYYTIYVTGSITGNVVATRSGSRSCTINFGTNDINGNLSITAPKATSIVLNDSAAGDDGSVITGRLTINAPNSEVTNNVKVGSEIVIQAVKLGTMNQNDVTPIIRMEGKGKLHVASTLPTYPTVVVATDAPVELSGTLGEVSVSSTNANVTVGAGTSLPGISVSGTGATITTNATIPQIQTFGSLTIEGSGTVTNVNVTGNGAFITVNGNATVLYLNEVNGASGTTINGTSTHVPPASVQKATAPTGLAGVAPTAAATNDGKITNVNDTMEYRLSTDTTYTAVGTGKTEITDLAAGTYKVRVAAVTGTTSILASDIVEVIVPAYVAPTVNAVAPVITTDLTDKTTTVGTGVTLNATATVSDGGTVSYAWYSNTTASTTGGTELEVTTATYEPPVNATGTTYYYCVVTNTNNVATGTKTATTTSAVSTVTVSAAPLLPSTAPSPADIIVTNNNPSADTVEVTNLTEGDVVKVYNILTGGTLLGTSAAVASGQTSATVTIAQIGTGAGNVYVTVTSTGKAESTPRVGKAYGAEVLPSIVVSSLALDSLVVAPVKGTTPVTTEISPAQYSGTIAWFESNGTTPVSGNFAASTVYVAKVTLTAKTGYTFNGVAENSFTYTGATSVANATDAGIVTITFPPTEADDVTIATGAIAGATAPVKGATPIDTIAETTEYTATIAWSPAHATFAADTAYTATITITPKAGYTLTGVAENFFTVAGATATNAAGTGVVTAVFPKTAAEVGVTNTIENDAPNKINVVLNLGVTGLVKENFAVKKGEVAYTTFTLTETDAQHYVVEMDDVAVHDDVFTVTITKGGFVFTGTTVTNNVL